MNDEEIILKHQPTAERLKKIGITTVKIKESVKALVKECDSNILRAHNAKRNNITVGLPTNFDIPNYKNEDAQRLIYYRLIRNLEKRGFSVGINLNKEKKIANLLIVWKIDEDNSEKNIINTFLGDKMLKYKELKKNLN